MFFVHINYLNHIWEVTKVFSKRKLLRKNVNFLSCFAEFSRNFSFFCEITNSFAKDAKFWGKITNMRQFREKLRNFFKSYKYKVKLMFWGKWKACWKKENWILFLFIQGFVLKTVTNKKFSNIGAKKLTCKLCILWCVILHSINKSFLLQFLADFCATSYKKAQYKL